GPGAFEVIGYVYPIAISFELCTRAGILPEIVTIQFCDPGTFDPRRMCRVFVIVTRHFPAMGVRVCDDGVHGTVEWRKGMPVEFGDSKCGLVRTAIEKIHPPIRVLEHIGVDAASFVWAHEGPLAGDGIAGGEGAFVFGGSIIELSVDYGYGGGIDLQGEAGGLDEMPVEEVGGPPIAHLFRGKKPVFVVIQNYQWI